MLETKQVIEELSGVHEAIRHYVAELKDNVGDLESLSSQCTGEWNSQQCRTIEERQFDLKQNIQYLEKGLQEHYEKESPLLKPLIGELLMKTISRECQEINSQFERAKALVAELSQGLPTARELSTKTTEARKVIETFSQLVNEHSLKMDMLLQMLKSAI